MVIDGFGRYFVAAAVVASIFSAYLVNLILVFGEIYEQKSVIKASYVTMKSALTETSEEHTALSMLVLHKLRYVKLC